MKPRIIPVTHIIHAGRFRIVRARFITFKIVWDKNHTTGDYQSIPEAMKVIAWRDSQLSRIRTAELFGLRSNGI